MNYKKLVIEDRNGTVLKTIRDFQFSELSVNQVNTITVFEDLSEYEHKIFKIFTGGKLIGSGIYENDSTNENLSSYEIELYPLIYDLRSGFIDDGFGNEVVHYNTFLENILDDAISKYRLNTNNPIISIGTLNPTGIKIDYTFSYKNYLEVINELIKYLDKTAYFRFNLDGSIDTGTVGTQKRLVYGKNISDIQFQKQRDGIINYVIFDNLIAGDAHILKTYQDATSIAKYGRKVYYRKDSRVYHEETADTLVNNFLDKNKNPKIIIEKIESTDLSINLYDKIRIDNWSKKFEDDLYVVGLTYTSKDTVMLQIDYKTIDRSQFQTVSDGVDISVTYTADRVPDYIQETYIDATTVRSPIIAGNDGYFSGVVKIGANGIIIDGVEKTISNSSYNAGTHSGWIINDDGTFEFGGDADNYIQRDGSTLNIRGTISRGDLSDVPGEYIYNSYITNGSASGTFINGTTIYSPTLAGDDGYIFGILEIGTDGVVIDGPNKLIKSSNFSTGSTGWQINNDGSCEFNDATIRGDFVAGSIDINSEFTVDSSGNVVGNNFTNKTIKFEDYGTEPTPYDGTLWCGLNPINKVLRGFFGGVSGKQQISMSKMQASATFNLPATYYSETITITTRFQPRMIMFTGWFQNTTTNEYGTTQGHAGNISATQGFCNFTKFNTSGGVGISVGDSNTAIGCDQYSSPNVRAHVSDWTDTSVVIEASVSAGSQRQFRGNILVFG